MTAVCAQETRPPEPHRAAHVVVVGVGGIGCPAAWGLAEAGVGRLTLVDPDVVALSNLPRQILYGPDDAGRPKAAVAAERLARMRSDVRGVVGRLDHANAERLLADADLVVDATDGALVKDWLNLECVRRRLPLIHAAGVRSEARLLDVPPGGGPCLACLFGRLEDEQGTCADLGVWGGVVGAVGFLAAAAALRRIARPAAPSEGYLVLDLESGRAVTLGAEASPGCPVCGSASPPEAESLPEPAGCAVDSTSDTPSADTPAIDERLDLHDEVCPLNLLRARAALEGLAGGRTLEILLGIEGAMSVPDGIRALGHEVLVEEPAGEGIRLVVRRTASKEAPATPALDRDDLLRYARQVVLPEVGEAGQRRLMGARVALDARGAVRDTATRYLEAAGVGEVIVVDGGAAVPRLSAWEDGEGAGFLAPDGGRPYERPGLPARVLGALLADALCRAVVQGSTPSLDLHVTAGGRIREGSPTS